MKKSTKQFWIGFLTLPAFFGSIFLVLLLLAKGSPILISVLVSFWFLGMCCVMGVSNIDPNGKDDEK